jgi:four helix bundle protein
MELYRKWSGRESEKIVSMEKPHKKLDVWKLSIELVKRIYEITASFPQHEVFGLTSQVRRSVVSIPSNIAEGAARQTTKELVNFLHISQGSLSELDTQLDISYELKYINETDRQDLDNIMVRINKMLSGLITSKKNR